MDTDSNRFEQYAAEIQKAVQRIQDMFPGLDLHNPVGIIVPDEQFKAMMINGGRPIQGNRYQKEWNRSG